MEQKIDLSGTWQVRLDPQDEGIEQSWWDESFTQTLTLPGSLQEQGFGDKPGPDTPWVGNVREDEWLKPKYDPYRSTDNFKWPFWLQPDKYYKGAAWYRKTVTIPENWAGRHIALELERPHWETRVWVDSAFAGSNNSLSVPHGYDLSRLLTPGKHVLTIRVDNRMIINVGPNSHSVSDHTQSNWNGLVGKLELTARPFAWIDDLQVYPNLSSRSIRVVTRLSGASGKATGGRLMFDLVMDGETVAAETMSSRATGSGENETVIRINEPVKMWNEFQPNLYTLIARLETPAGVDEETVVFGMRELGMQGTRFTMNGRPLFLRGTLECAIFPLTGYPPTDVESWKRIIRICKAHGLNHMRFHSWCPPEAAFIAADELGFYYQVECASWANQSAALGEGQPVDAWLYEEGERITRAYANHPSFVLMAYGNEPGGKKTREKYLADWCNYWKEKEPRALHTSGSGWPLIPESDFHVSPDPRIQRWGERLKSIINSEAPNTMFDFSDFMQEHSDKPTISHEIGQWCVYPNFDEMGKYTGVLKARNFEVFRDFLTQAGMINQAHDFLMASGKLQTLCYKADIEAALRTPGFGGFQLLDLHDFPGQGTALVGVLDPFWDSKPYVTAEEYSRFCAPIVPLVRLPKRIFKQSETLAAQIEVSQFGPIDLKETTVEWSLRHISGRVLKRGSLAVNDLPSGDLQPVGRFNINLNDLYAPAKYTLEVTVGKTGATNSWDIWVYPETVALNSEEITIVDHLDVEALEKLRKGGKVLLAVKPEQVKTDVALGFSSIFWNTAWTRGQAPHTLGILCDPEHPALADFPTEYHSNWQWSVPVQHAATMELDHLPKELKPIIQVVPDWFAPKKLALAFEAKVGGGSLLVCSVDLQTDIKNRAEIRQLRSSLISYMESDAFNPLVELSPEQIQSLMKGENL
jgi:hypothetical protein